MIVICFYLTALLALTNGHYRLGGELVRNGGFESPFNNDWYGNGCQIKRDTYKPYAGQHSGESFVRTASWAGISQNVRLQANFNYHLSAYVKISNTVAGKLWSATVAMLQVTYNDGSSSYHPFGSLTQFRSSLEWRQLGGDVRTPNRNDIANCRVYFQSAESGINFNVDNVSLRQIIGTGNFEQRINQDINSYRKSNVQIRTTVSGGRNPRNIQLEVRQRNQQFAFGTAVKASFIGGNDQRYEAYRRFFYNNFKWATLENAHKWKQMEWNRGQINYATPDAAVNAMRARGIKVRGHCVSWGVYERVPNWMMNMNGDQVKREVTRRINYVVDRYRGRVEHWDVNNEDLHGFFFQDKTRDADYLRTIFRETRDVDRSAKLFVNDFSIVVSSEITTEIANQAKWLKEAGFDVTIGVQGHFDGRSMSSPAVIKRRLDTLAEAGVDIWITELDVDQPDVNQRARQYEQLMKVFFSHPSVKGILVWGFWDGAHWKPNAALANGPNVQVNAAGRVWQRLTKQEWRTYQRYQLNRNSHTLNLRAFHGDYDVIIRENGRVLRTQTFSLPEGTPNRVVNVSI